jgi:hypothetical protein
MSYSASPSLHRQLISLTIQCLRVCLFHSILDQINPEIFKIYFGNLDSSTVSCEIQITPWRCEETFTEELVLHHAIPRRFFLPHAKGAKLEDTMKLLDTDIYVEYDVSKVVFPEVRCLVRTSMSTYSATTYSAIRSKVDYSTPKNAYLFTQPAVELKKPVIADKKKAWMDSLNKIFTRLNDKDAVQSTFQVIDTGEENKLVLMIDGYKFSLVFDLDRVLKFSSENDMCLNNLFLHTFTSNVVAYSPPVNDEVDDGDPKVLPESFMANVCYYWNYNIFSCLTLTCTYPKSDLNWPSKKISKSCDRKMCDCCGNCWVQFGRCGGITYMFSMLYKILKNSFRECALALEFFIGFLFIIGNVCSAGVSVP